MTEEVENMDNWYMDAVLRFFASFFCIAAVHDIYS
jgi:hypothetical protein